MADFKEDLETIVNQNAVKRSLEDFNYGSVKKDVDYGNLVEDLGGIVLPIEDSFLNATPQAIHKSSDNYVDYHKEAVNKAINEHKSKLVDTYTSVSNDLMQKIRDDLESKEDISKLSAEARTSTIGAILYQNIGTNLAQLDLNDKYAQENKQIAAQLQALKNIDEATESEKNEVIANSLREAFPWLKTDKNFVNYAPLDPDQAESIIARKIGKEFVTDSNGSYSFNRSKFAKAFDTPETYMKISPVVHNKLYGKK